MFALNDAVSVQREGEIPLEGVVAYIGDTVPFAAAQADGSKEEWLGVRLTGSSVGLGKNDGSVQGERFFTCPPLCGIFVRPEQVTKRTMTRLEALRLKRELETGGRLSAVPFTARTAGPSTPGTTRADPSPMTSPLPSSNSSITSPSAVRMATPVPLRSATSAVPSSRESKLARPASTPTLSSASAPAPTTNNSTTENAESSTDVTPAATVTTTRSRIEEIRKRRSALQDDGSLTGGPSNISTSEELATATTVESVQQQQQLQQQILQLQQQLVEWEQLFRKKESELAETTTQLSKAEQTTEQIREQLQQLQQQQQQHGAGDYNALVNSNLSEDKEELLFDLQSKVRDYQDRWEGAVQQISLLQKELDREQERRNLEQEELIQAKAEASSVKKELQTAMEQSAQRGSSDAVHYKERAKLQAEVSALKRKVEQAEKEKQDLENAIEDLTLDKEQLLQEKEALEDSNEELKIDAETAQIQVDELRMELEDARMAADRAMVASASAEGASASMDTEEKAQALALQNARLREALIRLREQSSVEKMELNRELRNKEKEVEMGKALHEELESLRALKVKYEDQINDLKDMIEQSSAFEGMVEDLSDRVLSLEEDNALLRATIREMEEAAELTAEMEEVQSDELKALAQDLETRDTIIRNLEEAIKMQRRREEDFRRTVGNYRNTVETLKLEKQTLLDMQKGGEGEKNNLIAASQKALSRAAQLVADSSAMRKREARAVMDHIDNQIYRHLSNRLETLLPPMAVTIEVAAIKGELLASKVVGKAAHSLTAISKSFGTIIKPPLPDHSLSEAESVSLNLTDDTKAELAVVFHQADFALDITNVSCHLLRFLAAGQWPDLMSPEASTEFGSLLGHCLSDLDSTLGHVLLSIKEEGTLTPDQSNIERLRQASRIMLQQLESDMERQQGGLLSSEWVPPGLELLKSASLAKFACLGAAAALSTIVQSAESGNGSIFQLYNKVEQCSTQASSICLRLANVDVKNISMVLDLSSIVSAMQSDAVAVLESVKGFTAGKEGARSCETIADSALRSIAKVSAMMRTANLNQNDDGSHHPLSPEVEDAWDKVSGLAKAIRAVDGDVEDVNYISRARHVENTLSSAIDNVPKLEIAESKITNLEKTLASRSKESAMLNARLSELERVLAKSSVSSKTLTDFKSSKEYNSLMDENRVLMEAMDVLQRQVDEYENEIRAMKDFKTPGRGLQTKRTPRRALTSVADLASPSKGFLDENSSSDISLEATIFRPALQQALRDALKWKLEATTSCMNKLLPLPGPFVFNTEFESAFNQLSSAIRDERFKKATIKLVDLRSKNKAPRKQFQESKTQCRKAAQEVEAIAKRCRGLMA